MNREQIIIVLKILKVAYPRFYADMTKEEAENTINLWSDMFKNENPELVIGAVKNLINHFRYPPTIADVKEEIYKATDIQSVTATEAWNQVREAIRNSGYHASEEFENLPKEAQRIVGSPTQLRDWAISTDFNESVVKGQFLKQFENLKTRDKEEKLMLPEYKRLITNLFENNSIKMIGGTNE